LRVPRSPFPLFRRCIERRHNVFLTQPTTSSSFSKVISIPESPWRDSQQDIFDHSLRRRAPGPFNIIGFLEAPKDDLYLRHSIEPQILRTCRLIYNEARYIMAKTNLFVKITITIPFDEIRPILKVKRLPILHSNQILLKRLKPFVMSHEIVKRHVDQESPMTPWTFVFLHRDLDRFCDGLANYQYVIKQHDELVSHIVTLVDYSQDGPHTSELYSREFQELLVAPYRDKLRGFPRFTIKGAIADDLAVAAMAQIARPRAEDPELVLSELEELKAKGNDSYGQGDKRMASEHWAQALHKMNRLMNGSSGEMLREAGGLDFVNRMIALYFDICSNRAQNHLKAMRVHLSDPELVRSYGESFLNSISWSTRPGQSLRTLPWCHLGTITREAGKTLIQGSGWM
jgi:hypothetical protein